MPFFGKSIALALGSQCFHQFLVLFVGPYQNHHQLPARNEVLFRMPVESIHSQVPCLSTPSASNSNHPDAVPGRLVRRELGLPMTTT